MARLFTQDILLCFGSKNSPDIEVTMRYIILTSALLVACLQSTIHAADAITSAPYPYWHSLPNEIQDTILDIIDLEEEKVSGKKLTPADYTWLYQNYATVRMVHMTQRTYRQTGKREHDELKKRITLLDHNLLMSLVDVDPKTILKSLRKEKSPQLEDTKQNNRLCALEHLNDIVMSLEKPLSHKIFKRFLTSSPELLLSKKPRALIPNLRFIRDYYSPFMLSLIKNGEYDLLSFLISHNYPLITGNMANPDLVILLEDKAYDLIQKHKLKLKLKSVSEPKDKDALKIMSIVMNAYRYEICKVEDYSWTHLHSPANSCCTII